MKVIITFTFCCDNLWKSKFMALENSGNFFFCFVATLKIVHRMAYGWTACSQAGSVFHV